LLGAFPVMPSRRSISRPDRIDGAVAPHGHATERKLGVGEPLRVELTPGVEYLHSPALVLAHVDPA
jgi:hypothetical protein